MPPVARSPVAMAHADSVSSMSAVAPPPGTPATVSPWQRTCDHQGVESPETQAGSPRAHWARPGPHGRHAAPHQQLGRVDRHGLAPTTHPPGMPGPSVTSSPVLCMPRTALGDRGLVGSCSYQSADAVVYARHIVPPRTECRT